MTRKRQRTNDKDAAQHSLARQSFLWMQGNDGDKEQLESQETVLLAELRAAYKFLREIQQEQVSKWVRHD